MSAKEVVAAIAAVLLGAGLGYFWHIMHPADGLLILVGVFLLCTGLIYVCLHGMGNH